ncbi:MAG: hypothetical protein R3F20_18455 [Planctomycetota bacterium]
MKDTLSPRDLARAIGVSESSMKRWADDGLVQTNRTPGGHRRIAWAEALRFIRESGSSLVRPELLGLESLGPKAGAEGEILHDLLASGDGDGAFSFLTSRFLDGATLVSLFDGPLRAAMQRLGELWRHESRGIFVEHRATDICLELIRKLRAGLPLRADSPVAIGGAPAGNHHGIGSLLAATVLEECGFRASNLGPDMPLEVLAGGARETGARLVWVSVALVENEEEFVSELRGLARSCGDASCGLAIGGSAVGLERLAERAGVAFGRDLAALASYGRGFLAATR